MADSHAKTENRQHGKIMGKSSVLLSNSRGICLSMLTLVYSFALYHLTVCLSTMRSVFNIDSIFILPSTTIG